MLDGAPPKVRVTGNGDGSVIPVGHRRRPLLACSIAGAATLSIPSPPYHRSGRVSASFRVIALFIMPVCCRMEPLKTILGFTMTMTMLPEAWIRALYV